MAQCTMRCSLNLLLVPVMILAASVTGRAQSRPYGLGTALSQEEIQGFDFMIGPAGKELPPGSGTPKEGAAIFAKQCAGCHGPNGRGGSAGKLAMGTPDDPKRGPFKDTERSVTSYYAYPTIAWDYINRAMPPTKPGSLTPSEVYSLVAFLFYQNGIIQESDTLDANSLPKIEMPNRNGFLPAVPVWPPVPRKPSWY